MEKLHARKRHEGLSPRFVALLHAIIRRALGDAVRLDQLSVNVALSARPRVLRRQGRTMNPEQARALLRAANGSERGGVESAGRVTAQRVLRGVSRRTTPQANEGRPVAVVALSGAIDAHSVERWRQLLYGEIDAHAGTTLTVDLSAVSFIDSTGLGVLVGAVKRAQQKECGLTFVRPPDRVRKVFTVTGLDRVFSFTDKEEEGAGATGLPPVPRPQTLVPSTRATNAT